MAMSDESVGMETESISEENSLSNELMDEMYNEVPKDPQADLVASASTEESMIASELNENFSYKQRLYEDVLAPQLEQNEALKREQKQELTQKVFEILKWQFIATYGFVLVIIIIIAGSSWLKLSDVIIGRIIDFIQFYITSIIAELIAILFFIVKNVFDKSIVDLFKNFDSKIKDEKSTDK